MAAVKKRIALDVMYAGIHHGTLAELIEKKDAPTRARLPRAAERDMDILSDGAPASKQKKTSKGSGAPSAAGETRLYHKTP